MKSKLEYIWLDGNEPTQTLRGKTMVRSDFGGTLAECPMWSFDGSSTNQADGGASDCLLKPVAIIPDPDRANAYLVMTEVLNADGTPHVTNGRATIDEADDDEDFWFGFEQEYFLWDPVTDRPPGFPANGYPEPQGPYYCSVGAKNAFGRDIVEEHLDICLDAGLNVEGINGEVAAGQWEFQIFAKGAKRAGDEIWLARYLLERTGEKYGLAIDYHPKPLGDTDWNGSRRVCQEHRSPYERVRRIQRPAPHRSPRDPVDRSVQLRRLRPRCIDSYPDRHGRRRLEGSSRGPSYGIER